MRLCFNIPVWLSGQLPSAAALCGGGQLFDGAQKCSCRYASQVPLVMGVWCAPFCLRSIACISGLCLHNLSRKTAFWCFTYARRARLVCFYVLFQMFAGVHSLSSTHSFHKDASLVGTEHQTTLVSSHPHQQTYGKFKSEICSCPHNVHSPLALSRSVNRKPQYPHFQHQLPLQIAFATLNLAQVVPLTPVDAQASTQGQFTGTHSLSTSMMGNSFPVRTFCSFFHTERDNKPELLWTSGCLLSGRCTKFRSHQHMIWPAAPRIIVNSAITNVSCLSHISDYPTSGKISSHLWKRSRNVHQHLAPTAVENNVFI